METKDQVQNIQDAIELVKMLEQLCDGYALQQQSNDSVAWRGINLTLTQVRKKLIQTEDYMSVETMISSQSEYNGNSNNGPTKRKSSLADRIQPSPVGGTRVRELISNSGSESIINPNTSIEDRGGKGIL